MVGEYFGAIHDFEYNIGDKIYRVSSKDLSEFAKSTYQDENKKIMLNAHITLRKNEPITLQVSTSNNINKLFDK